MFKELNEKLNIISEQTERLSRDMGNRKCFQNSKTQYMKLKIHWQTTRDQAKDQNEARKVKD